MTKQILFWIWVIGAYLEFGGWNLVILYHHAPCVSYRTPFVEGTRFERSSKETAPLAALPNALKTASTI